MYHIDLKHDGLGKFRRLSGADQFVLEQRARLQAEAWESRWRRRLAHDQQGDESLRHLPNFEAQQAHAAMLTDRAQQVVASFTNILSQGLDAAPFKMEMLHDSRIFPEDRPVTPVDQEAPLEPDRDDPSFNVVEQFDVKAEFWALFLPKVRRKLEMAAQAKTEAARSRYDTACRNWQDAKLEVARLNAKRKAMFDAALDAWWVRAQAYQDRQRDENTQVDRFGQRYAQKNTDAVVEYFDAALSQADYPDIFPMQWDVDFLPETGALIIDYELPPPEDFPTLKGVKYDVMQDTFEQSYWSAPEIADLYEGAIYQTCLRTLHDMFEADAEGVAASVTFNGWVSFFEKSQGRPARACIMSVQATKAAMKQADLRASSPKACFGRLKGIAGARLAEMTAVVPIQPINRQGVVRKNSAVESD